MQIYMSRLNDFIIVYFPVCCHLQRINYYSIHNTLKPSCHILFMVVFTASWCIYKELTLSVISKVRSKVIKKRIAVW